ncbi:MAG TPA: hypothetical protein VFU40_12130, partial [Gemmatimonadales bacterium]|nr:hypothetical protein [Gemmatimonadales bacterium]
AAGPAPTRAPDTPAAQIQEPSESPTLASPEAVVPDLPSIEIAGQDIVEPAPERQKQAETPPAQTRPAEPWPLILEQPPEVAEQAAAGVPSITDTPDPSRAGPIAPLPGLISQEFEAPEGAREFPVEPLEIDVEPSQEVVLEGSGASEFRVPNAAEDFQEAGSAQGTGFFSEFRVPDASEEFREAAEARAAAEAKAAAERRAMEAERRAMEAEGRAMEEEKAIAAPAEPRVEASSTTAAALEPGPPSYSTRDTKGQSVAAFFRGMLASRPPGDAATPGAPAPEQAAASSPVQDGLSLSSVGQDDSRKADADVSFDDFFGSVSKGSGAEKAADPGKDDLDQFHSWLQNLKR